MRPQAEVMDAFLGFCDLSSGNPSMILGPEMRKLTLEELWGDIGGKGEGGGSSDEDARLAKQSLIFIFCSLFQRFVFLITVSPLLHPIDDQAGC